MRKPWIRLYTEVPDDPRVQTLSDRLFKFWVNCLCLAGRFDGSLPGITDMAFILRMPPASVEKMLLELAHPSVGLLERQGDSFRPHNWDGRQYERDVSTKRVREFRERRRKHDGTVSGNTLVTAHAGARSGLLCSVSDSGSKTELSGFSKWIEPWPRVPNQDSAARAWLSIDLDEATERLAFEARDRYLASDEVSRNVIADPVKFLFEQAKCGWSGKWPRSRDARGAAQPTPDLRTDAEKWAAAERSTRAMVGSPEDALALYGASGAAGASREELEVIERAYPELAGRWPKGANAQKA